MKIITSRSNPEVQQVTSLHHTKHRDIQKQFIAEGFRTCTTLLHAGHTPISFYVTEENLEQARQIVSEEVLRLVSSHVMEKMSTTKAPSGVLGVFRIPQSPPPDYLAEGIVLARVSNPGNMGTLIRTCAAMGFKSVVRIQGADPYSPKVIQASAGSIGYIHLFDWTWQELEKNKGTKKLCALVVANGKKPEEIDFTDTLLVIGSEAHGIPDEWLATCDSKLTLPMPGDIESLNAAVAGSIALYLMAHSFSH